MSSCKVFFIADTFTELFGGKWLKWKQVYAMQYWALVLCILLFCLCHRISTFKKIEMDDSVNLLRNKALIASHLSSIYIHATLAISMLIFNLQLNIMEMHETMVRGCHLQCTHQMINMIKEGSCHIRSLLATSINLNNS